MRWIAFLVLPAVLLLAAACEEEDGGEGTPTATVEAASSSPTAAQPTNTPHSLEPTATRRPTPRPQAQLSLLHLQCAPTAGYGRADGVIMNSGTSLLSALQPSVIFRDASGSVAGSGTGWVNINELSPGQESPFLAQTLSPIGPFDTCSVQFQGIVGRYDVSGIAEGRFPPAATSIPLIDGR